MGVTAYRRAHGLRGEGGGGVESEYDVYDDDDGLVVCPEPAKKMIMHLPWPKHALRPTATLGVVAVATTVVVVVRPAKSSSSLRTAVLGVGSGAAALPPLPFPSAFPFPFDPFLASLV